VERAGLEIDSDRLAAPVLSGAAARDAVGHVIIVEQRADIGRGTPWKWLDSSKASTSLGPSSRRVTKRTNQGEALTLSGLPLPSSMIIYPTMPKAKVAITLERSLLNGIDELVAGRRFPNRSQAIESAVAEKLERLKRGRLARESAKLDRAEERAAADEGLAADGKSWPEY
jgi:Arc/MetJ-type ribon-helix-helix transcriptional regulator